MLNDYQLDKTVLKTSRDLTLCRNDRVAFDAKSGCLAVAVRDKDKVRGYVLQGNTKLLIDTIVETEKGAVGNPIDMEVTDPFLMLGKTELVEPYLQKTNSEDLSKLNASQGDFLTKAEELVNEHLHADCCHGHRHFNDEGGTIFMLPNGGDGHNVLQVQGSNVIYAGKEISFISNPHKSVLKTNDHVIVSDGGRSVVVQKLWHRHGMHCR